LVKWTNLPETDASWEDYDFIRQTFPTALLEVKKNFKEEAMSDTEVADNVDE
jgi:hypothetical protein